MTSGRGCQTEIADVGRAVTSAVSSASQRGDRTMGSSAEAGDVVDGVAGAASVASGELGADDRLSAEATEEEKVKEVAGA